MTMSNIESAVIMVMQQKPYEICSRVPYRHRTITTLWKPLNMGRQLNVLIVHVEWDKTRLSLHFIIIDYVRRFGKRDIRFSLSGYPNGV